MKMNCHNVCLKQRTIRHRKMMVNDQLFSQQDLELDLPTYRYGCTCSLKSTHEVGRRASTLFSTREG